ncbi:hypothetical protein [Mucilaginibacter sp.]|uniref:hypothetical protein n=1 Tax=Mucilaginibacter sp. TaxID=1882438 RepID=UPI0035BC7E0D
MMDGIGFIFTINDGTLSGVGGRAEQYQENNFFFPGRPLVVISVLTLPPGERNIFKTTVTVIFALSVLVAIS